MHLETPYTSYQETGARSWIFWFMLWGKTWDLGLGATAGADALSWHELVMMRLRFLKIKAGIDPLDGRERKVAEALAVHAY